MMAEHDIETLAASVLEACRARGWMLAAAESCTGGMVSAALTAIAGSSDVVDRGFTTYSNEAKMEMLGVPEHLIASHGAVSFQVAEAMAAGAIAHSRATIAVSITGIAGPGGGSATKPVGLVYLACATRHGKMALLERRYGEIGRREVRQAAAGDALALMLQVAGDS
jgi:nicotinamide-nucleotide amidase